MSENSYLVPYNFVTGAAGAGAAAAVSGIADAARSIACPLYRDFPAFMTGSWANNPLANYNDGLLNALCAPANQLPTPPATQPTGGQCPGVQYRVTANLSSEGQLPTTVNNTFTGTFVSLQSERGNNDNSGNPTFNAILRTIRSSDGVRLISNVFGPSGNPIVITNVQITRVDGLPDTCGDAPIIYPKDNPPPALLNPTINLKLAPNFTVNAPVTVFAPIDTFAPSLKIGDFNIDFNLGGLNITPTLNVNLPGSRQGGSNPPTPPAGQTPSDRNQDEFNGVVLRYLKRLRDCQNCDLDYDFNVTGVVGGSANSITVPIGAIPLTAAVTLISLPTNKKIQPGRGQPDVVFAGWAWWSGNDYMTERMPIDANTKLFYAPENPSPAKFHYTVTPGYSAQALMSYKIRKNPLPPL